MHLKFYSCLIFQPTPRIGRFDCKGSSKTDGVSARNRVKTPKFMGGILETESAPVVLGMWSPNTILLRFYGNIYLRRGFWLSHILLEELRNTRLVREILLSLHPPQPNH